MSYRYQSYVTHSKSMWSSEKLKVLFAVTILFTIFTIFARLPRQSRILRKIVFRNNSSHLSLDSPVVDSSNNNITVMPGSKIVAQKVPNDDPYSAILHVDKVTPFLDPEARSFLHYSRFFTFPTKYKKVFVDTLVEFDRVWRQKLNRTYILYHGTLLGAYRHGQAIPWDDDLDVLVDLKYNKTLEQDFNGTNFTVRYKTPFRKLFFTHNGTTTNRYGHWPFIDLFFFKRLAGGQKIETVGFNYVYPINDVFPATPIPFEGRMLLGPRCFKTVAEISIRISFYECCSYDYNHRLDRLKNPYCISCSKLRGLFRFVTWRRINATHSQQMTSELPEPHNMAAVYKSKKEVWEKGPVVFMPRC